jgi:phenylalanyl-tRNA synthetase beta chain
MLFLKSWLEDYIDLSDIDNEELSKLISLKSGEVEYTKTFKDYFDEKILVGKIANLRKHPNADKLNIFDINFGEKINSVQIISAASNVYEGMFCPAALVGCKLPYLFISERKMRGESSFGMCLGKSELMLETQTSDGLWDLSKEKKFQQNKELLDQKLGLTISEVFPEYFEEETIFDIKYLADKFASCSCHLGLALEIAFLLKDKTRLKDLAKNLLKNNTNTSISSKILEEFDQKSTTQSTKINFKDEDNYANNFSLYEVKLTQKFQFPAKLQKRMFLTQKNLVNNFADLSNYLLWDVGQPSHFFSQNKLNKIFFSDNTQVSLSPNLELNWEIKNTTKVQKFEGLGQLKNTEIPVQTKVLVQKNKKNEEIIISIPGVSGSEKTKIDENDLQVFVELANFFPEKISKTTFVLNYRSDGSRFWSSGVKPATKNIWLKQFINILKQNNIQLNFQKILQLENKTNQNLGIKVDFEYISSRLDGRNLEFWEPEIKKILNLIGIFKDEFFYPNLYYSNISSQEDLLYEVARLVGFDYLQKSYFKFSSNFRQNNNFQNFFNLKKVLTNYNFNEIISRPFVAQENLLASLIGADNSKALEAISFQRKDENFLQDSFLANLLKTLAQNMKKGEKNPQIFQLGKIYQLNSFYKLEENIYLEALISTKDPYISTSLLQDLSQKLNGNLKVLSQNKSSDNWENLGKNTIYQFISDQKNTYIWNLLQLKNSQKKKFEIDISKKIWYLKLDLPQSFSFNSYKKYCNESDFPLIKRSYSWIIPNNLLWETVNSAILENKIKDKNFNLEVLATPLERFVNEDSQQIINFEAEFWSYTQTLEGGQILNWENNLIQNLQKKGYKITMRNF